jgi:mitochondrial fission protein ELM1
MYLKRFREQLVSEPNALGQECRYIKRTSLAAPVDNVAVVVYTFAAYIQDPDCSEDERKRVMDMGLTHVLVAVLASAGRPSTLTAHRFVANLAGGNNEALAWTADEIRQKAKEIKDFTSKWSVVAD